MTTRLRESAPQTVPPLPQHPIYRVAAIFEGHYLKNGATYARPNYDVSPDGQRFLMLKPVEQKRSGPTEINVVLNWTEELKRLVPTGTK